MLAVNSEATDATGLAALGGAFRRVMTENMILSASPRRPGGSTPSGGHRPGMPPAVGVHAVYAVLIHTTGFVAWEIPRTRRQAQAVYASSWRREFAGLPLDELPLVGGILDELPLVASDKQFEIGLAVLTRGLVNSA
jgi:hypothetical protein